MSVPRDGTKIKKFFYKRAWAGYCFLAISRFQDSASLAAGRGYMLDDLRVIFRTRGKTLFPDARIGTLPVADFAVN